MSKGGRYGGTWLTSKGYTMAPLDGKSIQRGLLRLYMQRVPRFDFILGVYRVLTRSMQEA
jgi:hypothetical protein